ncbi:vomeronasal 1 receptor ornAnaV1R3154 [Ornithorhynchus anatinus]|uniref:Vomeronasal type-1 receptor n=1 Tax=Ornithorhynchus anatinus TaxID=9258 RepID=A0A6I8PKU3_ORNAN|nr:vomeronasal 1 receptor ornAnaV1R3154 [Ornithorhynchus anatinus]
MDTSDISFGIVFLLQISAGLSVNAYLLLFYTRLVSTSHKLSTSDFINAQLTLSNTMILLTGGIPDTLSAWGLRNLLDDIGCKILIYFYRVARGLSICTTCLLSVFQAITISPGTFWWARIKAKLSTCVIHSCILFWIFNLIIYISALMYVTGPRNSTSVKITMDLKYCTVVPVSTETTLIKAVGLSAWDLLFVGLMSGASSYLVFVLCRHHKRVQHLHGPSQFPKTMPEVRAGKRVIALVILYLVLYGRQSIMFSVLLSKRENSSQLVNSHVVFSLTFSVLSPFLIIHSDRRMRPFWKREASIPNTNPS